MRRCGRQCVFCSTLSIVPALSFPRRKSRYSRDRGGCSTLGENCTGLPVALWRVALLGECQKRGGLCERTIPNTRDELTANGRHLTKSRTISIAPIQKIDSSAAEQKGSAWRCQAALQGMRLCDRQRRRLHFGGLQYTPCAAQSRPTVRPPRVLTGVPSRGFQTPTALVRSMRRSRRSQQPFRRPSSSAAARLLRKAGNASAKQTIIKKCGVEFRPGVTCTSEYLRGIVAL
jgi:hypothetical protein